MSTATKKAPAKKAAPKPRTKPAPKPKTKNQSLEVVPPLEGEGDELIRVHPNDLVLAANIRRKVDITSDGLLESVAAAGVKTPLRAKRDELGQIVVIEGQRRLLAAREAGLMSVLVHIVPGRIDAAGDDAAVKLEQLALNEVRSEMTMSDRAAAVADLLFAYEPEVIAREAGVDVESVRALKEVAESGVSAETIDEVPALTMVQAARLAAIVDDECFDLEEDLHSLETDLKSGREPIDQVLSRWEKSLETEREYREFERPFRDSGVRIERGMATYGTNALLEDLVDGETGEELDPIKHEECAGHVVVISRRYDYSTSPSTMKLSATPCCMDYRDHGHLRRYEYNNEHPAPVDAEEQERLEAERAAREARMEHIEAADNERGAFLATQVADMSAVDVTEVMAWALRPVGTYEDGQFTSPRDLLKAAGFAISDLADDPEAGAGDWAVRTKVNQRRYLAAAALATLEDRFLLGSTPEGLRLVERELFYLTWLKARGYGLAAVEEDYLEELTAARKELQAELEREAADADDEDEGDDDA